VDICTDALRAVGRELTPMRIASAPARSANTGSVDHIERKLVQTQINKLASCGQES
jgi:hypothetical protein